MTMINNNDENIHRDRDVSLPPPLAAFEKPSSLSVDGHVDGDDIDDKSFRSHASKGSTGTTSIDFTDSGSTASSTPTASSSSSSGQHQYRLEDVCRVRDEATALRDTICELRSRLEDVQEERDFQAAKANEFADLLSSLRNKSMGIMNSNDEKTKMDNIHKELVKKSVQVAGMAAQLEKAKAEKQALMTQTALLEKQRDSARSEMGDLSLVVRSLQTFSYSMDEEDKQEDEDMEEEEEVVLNSETALNMTLGNMKSYIETLEDSLQKKSATVKKQKKQIAFLEKENEMCTTKVGMLEQLFRELNQERIEEEEKEVKTKGSSQSSLGSSDKTRSSTASRPSSISTASEKGWFVPKLNLTQRISDLTVSTNTSRTSTSSSSKVESPLSIKHAVSTGGTTKQHEKMSRIKICFKKAGLEGTYTGPLVDGKPHGMGTIRFSNGDTYIGEMQHGKMSGKKSTLYTKDRGIFRGIFQNNKYVGPSKPDKAALEPKSPAHSRRVHRREQSRDATDNNLSRRKSSQYVIEVGQ
mmetsp:Transcript_37393/g.90889  ORF Transcript_37393/g.90889 Transcript_37393/m.90889 type:complete len:525 (+) Transcript_37393:246-1820(+)|eukprot:CAMPEP_0113454842 /NCGR_PEP_ID=MMETSP0014_2-20120614/8071_1 /TAXON_ID=2857 /ORGANISM="Nitzschia sp." /LENGTH=524 /DNA_ID=CAMNT_0000346259 /DNA_START=155 /DNA_END=1729 /DNA_ORIENTATION=- /assembly_acc=CAM_ASM_000159